MSSVHEVFANFEVALRKESVDRNCGPQGSGKTLSMSLSARRAWIEIENLTAAFIEVLSLSARRAWIEISVSIASNLKNTRRSPQGERG